MNPKKSKKIYRNKNYTQVPDTCLEKLSRMKFQKYEWQVLMILIRKIWGWQKGQDWISLSQIAEMTGIQATHISRTIKQLVNRKIIFRCGNTHRIVVQINENYDEWLGDVLPNVVTNDNSPNILPEEVINDTESGNTEIPDEATTIDTNRNNITTNAPPDTGGAHASISKNTTIVTKKKGAAIASTEDLQDVNNISKRQYAENPEISSDGNANDLDENCAEEAEEYCGREEGEQSPTMAIGVHLLCTRQEFPNYEALKQHINKNIRESRRLRFYTPRQIATACVAAMAEGSELGYSVDHLSTAAKKISLYDVVSTKQSVIDYIDKCVARYENEEGEILTENSSLIKQ